MSGLVFRTQVSLAKVQKGEIENVRQQFVRQAQELSIGGKLIRSVVLDLHLA